MKNITKVLWIIVLAAVFFAFIGVSINAQPGKEAVNETYVGEIINNYINSYLILY